MASKRACGKKLLCLFGVGVLLLVIGGVMFPVLNYIIKKEIKKRVVISNTSELYDIWQDIPVPVYMQFYMFNVTNPEETQSGGKPDVVQVGPYTYRERRVKFDIVWNPNGTVTYKQNRTFTFLRNMSVAEDTETLTTLNPLIAVISHSLQQMPTIVRETVSFVLTLIQKEELFITRPVHELLWGYPDPALVRLNSIIPSFFPTTHIGYFIRRNYTDDGLYTVWTGEKDVDVLGEITRYNGKSHLDIWTTKWANMVNGTDGTLSPPFRFDAEWSPLYVSDICRSIRGIYRSETHTPQGIRLRRFGGNPYDMANATENPDNIGFCTPQTNCLPTGLLNSIKCQEPVDSFPLPIVFSFPHFLYADPKVINSVDGIQPNKAEHDTTVDVEPWTGLVLQAAKRLQINMFIEKVDGIKQTHNISALYFPILWLNESSVVDDKHADMLKDQLFTPMKIGDICKFVLIGIGCLVIIVCCGLLIREKYLLSKDRANQESGSADGEETEKAPQDPSAFNRDGSPTANGSGDAYGSVNVAAKATAPMDESEEKTPLLTADHGNN